MTTDKKLSFAKKTSEVVKKSQPWNILIVDDEEEIHAITTLVLKNFTFKERELNLYSVYSAKEAKEFLKSHDEIAVIFLDVVMEQSDSGLQVVDYIRNDLKNKFSRIIIRTGQPGDAPELELIVKYDINDYKEKSELTVTKLYTTLVASLRSYDDIIQIEKNRQGLEQVVRASGNLFEFDNIKVFASGLLEQIASFMKIGDDILFLQFSGSICTRDSLNRKVLAGCGLFAAVDETQYELFFSEEEQKIIRDLPGRKTHHISKHLFLGYYLSDDKSENVIIYKTSEQIGEAAIKLIDIFSTNLGKAFDNICLSHEVEEIRKEVILSLNDI